MLASLRARIAGKSYWSLRYIDGTTINEWDQDWSLVPFAGRQSLRLYCPNGKVAELGSRDATGRLFQLKVAVVTMGGGSGTLAHLIGIVQQPDGTCQFAAWDYQEGKLVSGYDNVNAMRFHNLGQLAHGPMGLSYE